MWRTEATKSALKGTKGSDSFEVQIDLDGGKAKNVDVTTNAWQSEATERALDASKR